MSDKNSDLILSLRNKFLAEYETNPDLFNPIDVERVKTDDWQIQRYILEYHSEEEAFKQLIRVLKWKQSYGLHERTDEYFPREFHIIFGHEEPSRDKDGRYVSWNIEDRYRKIGELSPLIQQFLCHKMEKLDTYGGPNGVLPINNLSKAGLFNVDMNMANFRTDQLNQYPKILYKSLNVDMPWVMSSAFKIVKGLMPKHIRDTVVVIKREQLTDYVHIESIPECFGGQRPCSSVSIQHYKPLSECKHLGLNEKLVQTFYNTYKEYF